MATNTTNNYFSKPAVGGDTDTWGATLNSNWDTVDSVLAGDTDILALSVVPASATDIAASFSGYVGIGTSNPSIPLHLTATTNVPALIETTHTDGNARLRFTTASGTDWNIGSNTNGNFTLFDAINNNNIFVAEAGAGASTLVIDSNSRVGIGTDSPDSILTIDKDVSTAFDSSDDGAQRSNTNTLHLKNEDGTANSFAQIAFDLGASNQPIARIAGINTGTSSSALAFVVEGSNVKREAMRIDSSSNVGIGTTSPYVKTEIVGGDFAIGGGAGSGQLGLEVRGTPLQAIPSAQVRGYVATGDSGIGVAGDLLIAPRTSAAASVRFITGTSPAERLRIDSSGNVGIGTNNPTEQLHITGNLKVDGVIRSATFDSGESTTVNVLCDDAGNADLNLMGGNQGTGRLYVGQSSTHGGGIEYNGDSNPLTSGGGSDQIVLYRRSSGVNEWTARNAHSSNDWEFRGKVTADELAGTLASTIFNQIYPVGSIYISISPSFDPNSAFTGSWTQISGGEVLVAEGGTFTCGAGGGSSTHNHDVTVTRDGWGSYQPSTALRQPSIDGRLITGSGNSEIGENLESLAEATGNKTFTTDNTSTYPPYRVVAIWKRNS